MIDAGIEQEQRALAEIVQDERREHERIPGKADRLLAEMSHVRIERFPTGHDEKHRAENREAGEAVRGKERDGVARVEGAEHGRQAHDPADAQYRKHDEPHDHDWTEESADTVRAVLLNQKESDQNRRP